MNHQQYREDPIYLSPLKLICSAYTDEQPVMTPSMLNHLLELERFLIPLSEQDKQFILHRIFRIYAEKESLAFQAGMRAGIQLIRELTEL